MEDYLAFFVLCLIFLLNAIYVLLIYFRSEGDDEPTTISVPRSAMDLFSNKSEHPAIEPDKDEAPATADVPQTEPAEDKTLNFGNDQELKIDKGPELRNREADGIAHEEMPPKPDQQHETATDPELAIDEPNLEPQKTLIQPPTTDKNEQDPSLQQGTLVSSDSRTAMLVDKNNSMLAERRKSSDYLPGLSNWDDENETDDALRVSLTHNAVNTKETHDALDPALTHPGAPKTEEDSLGPEITPSGHRNSINSETPTSPSPTTDIVTSEGDTEEPKQAETGLVQVNNTVKKDQEEEESKKSNASVTNQEEHESKQAHAPLLEVAPSAVSETTSMEPNSANNGKTKGGEGSVVKSAAGEDDDLEVPEELSAAELAQILGQNSKMKDDGDADEGSETTSGKLDAPPIPAVTKPERPHSPVLIPENAYKVIEDTDLIVQKVAARPAYAPALLAQQAKEGDDPDPEQSSEKSRGKSDQTDKRVRQGKMRRNGSNASISFREPPPPPVSKPKKTRKDKKRKKSEERKPSKKHKKHR